MPGQSIGQPGACVSLKHFRFPMPFNGSNMLSTFHTHQQRSEDISRRFLLSSELTCFPTLITPQQQTASSVTLVFVLLSQAAIVTLDHS